MKTLVNDSVSGGEERRRCCSLPCVDEERRRLFPVVEVVSDGFPVVEVVSDGGGCLRNLFLRNDGELFEKCVFA